MSSITRRIPIWLNRRHAAVGLGMVLLLCVGIGYLVSSVPGSAKAQINTAEPVDLSLASIDTATGQAAEGVASPDLAGKPAAITHTNHTLFFPVLQLNPGATPPTVEPPMTHHHEPTDKAETIPASYQQWGIYPNCIPPAVPVESQSWWHEKANPIAGDTSSLLAGSRHVHIGMCFPNARTVNGKELIISGVQDMVAVVMLHNNPGGMTWFNLTVAGGKIGKTFVRDHPSLTWRTQSKKCTGSGQTCVMFKPALTCPNRGLCTYQIPIRMDFGSAGCGLCELRMRPNLNGIPPRGDRQFSTLNFQIHLGGSSNYRKTAAPIGRSWYTDLNYANVTWNNYMDLFQGRTDISIPIVKGTISIAVSHAEANGLNPRSKLFIDPNAHGDHPGTIIYDKPGAFRGTIKLDTTKLSNGNHALLFLTQEDNEMGTNAGLLKLMINVQN